MYAFVWIASSMLKYEGDEASRSFLPEMAWKTTGNLGVANCGDPRKALIVFGSPQTSSSAS